MPYPLGFEESRTYLVLKAALVVVIPMSIGSCVFQPNVVDPYETARAEFASLLANWEVESRAAGTSSNVFDYWEGDAARQIVAMGKRALPFIIEELKSGNFFFNVAMERIVGTTKARGELAEQAISKCWLQWWNRKRSDPHWNVFGRR